MKLLLIGISLIAAFAQDATKPAQDTTPPASQAAAPKDQKDAAQQKDTAAKDQTPPKDAAAPAEQQAAAAAAPAATPPPKAEPSWTGSVDVGYRARTGVAGSDQTYRSVVNLEDGIRLFGFDLAIQSPTRKYFDKITLFGEGWGGDPQTTARLNAMKERVYDLYFNYRNIAYFNFLPSFANPFVDQGSLLTEHGFNIRRRIMEGELRFRPGTRIIPYLAFEHDSGEGTGLTTFVGPSNEYPTFMTWNDGTNRYRAGVSFEMSKFHLTLEQGGTTFKQDQTNSDNTQQFGNNRTPVLGQQLYLNNVLQAYRIRGSSIFSRGLLTYSPFSWVDITGQFLYSIPQTDTNYNSNATGNFFNQATAQFLQFQQDLLSASANAPHSTGNVNIELRPIHRVRILESWTTDRFHDASAAMLSDLTTLTPQALLTLSTDRLVLNYSREETDAIVDAFRWLTLRGGYRYVWGDATVRGNPLESPTPLQEGTLRQHVGLAGAQIRPTKKLWINADLEIGRAGQSYFRTSLYNYEKGTARARYQLLNSFQLTASTSVLYNSNPTPGVNFDFESHQSSAGFFWNPKSGKRFTLLGEYTRATIYSSIPYFIPQTLTQATSLYRENAHIATALFDVAPLTGKYAPRLSVGGSLFISAGSRPENYYQPITKLSVPLHERVQLFADWRWYSMTDNYYLYESFRTHIFETGLRFTR